MCGAGHHLRMIPAALRLCCARFRLTIQGVIAVLLLPPNDRRPTYG